jgi:phage/plasmid-associated DNA primase
MTNDLPKIDGTDEGVKRRVRVLPYVSKFVTSDNEVNDEPRERYEEQYVFKANSEITYLFRDNDELKMEYMRYLLDNYDHNWKYQMTKTIQESSEEYLCENDGISKFVSEYLERDKESFVTLKEIKEMLKNCDYYDGKANVLKNRLERVMKTKCIDNKRFDNKKYRYAFIGYRWIDNEKNDEIY